MTEDTILNRSDGRDAMVAPTSDPYVSMVLLVDDQAMVGEAVRRMLANEPDVAFQYCGDPAEAVGAVERVKPTVILQDLVMPGVDGLTLVRRYRANAATKDIPVIVLSTKEDPVVKKDAFTAGANDYLVKLPDKIELVARIRLHSKAYLNQIQRDEAYRSLTESQRDLLVSNDALAERISELQVVRDELSRLVGTDALTGLCSRRRFFESAATEFIRYRRYGRPVAFLMADLDLFKRINDTYGHDTGDEVLKEFAGVLRAVSRQSDVAGRIGGEEFAMMLPETATRRRGGSRSADRCRLSSARHCHARGPREVFVQCRCGRSDRRRCHHRRGDETGRPGLVRRQAGRAGLLEVWSRSGPVHRSLTPPICSAQRGAGAVASRSCAPDRPVPQAACSVKRETPPRRPIATRFSSSIAWPD